MRATGWRETTTFAWTESDGPGRPPGGHPRAVLVVLAGSLGAVLAGLFASDTLCPEHRTWVGVLAYTGVIGSVAAITALARGWAGAAPLTVLVAATGVSIGLLDAIHDPVRGALVAAGFGIVMLGAALLLARDVRLRAWDRTLARSTAPEPVPADDVAASRSVRH